jgi:hypothetical protein
MASYNEQLYENSELPLIKIEEDPRRIKMFGGNRLLIPSALEINALMAQVTQGKLIKSDQIRAHLAKIHDADYTCPVTTNKFILLSAKAAQERGDNSVPYWRTLGGSGQLNARYPGGIDSLKDRLEQEGFTVFLKGKNYFVEDMDKHLFQL